jgi:hypothetical protein
MIAQQVLRLVFEMVEIRVWWELSYWHDELPFARPMSAGVGRKSVRKNELSLQVDFCPFREPDAPLTQN